jgi:V/A-type H+-transporting ATPase subunit E
LTTIEDKIRLFSKIIYDRIKEEKQVEFDNFEIEKEKKLQELKKELEDMRADELQEASKKAKIKAVEKLSKEKIKFQQRELMLREDMMKEVNHSVKVKISNYVTTADYESLLLKGIKNTLDKLDKNQYNVYLIREDIDKIRESLIQHSVIRNINIDIREADNSILGGFIIEDKEKKFRIDNSLKNKLYDLKGHIGLAISESLK